MSLTPRHRRQFAIVLAAILVVAGVAAGSIWWPRKHAMPYKLDYDRLIQLDAEDLAETGIAEAYQEFLPELRKEYPQVEVIPMAELDLNAPMLRKKQPAGP